MTARFAKTEQDFIKLVNKTPTFKFEGKTYHVVGAYKPKPRQGECKTDVFIRTREGRDLKISIKQSNADFVENKMNYERAVQIFGAETDDILRQSILRISHSFREHPLVSFEKNGRTEAKTIILGWKFELLNRKSGQKSGELLLTDAQKFNVYSGSLLDESKRNALVNGSVVANSGVAEHILVMDGVQHHLQYYIDKLQDIKTFARKQKMYFACKALNYRAKKDKWDGDRPLAVYVNWTIKSQLLTGDIIYNRPLKIKGNSVGNTLKRHLDTLGIKAHNFDELKKHYSGNAYP